MVTNRLKHIFAAILILLAISLFAGHVDAAQDVVSLATNLRVYYTNSGMTNRLYKTYFTNDLVVTNYDYDFLNPNAGPPALVYGRTNWYPMTITNHGGVRSKPDTFFLTGSLLQTGGQPGFKVLFSIPGTNTVANTNAIHFLVGISAPLYGTNINLIARIVSVSTNPTNSFSAGLGRVTNLLTMSVKPPVAAGFSIIHPGVVQVGSNAMVRIVPYDTGGQAIRNYLGMVTVDVFGESAASTITWNGPGSLVDFGDGRASFMYAASNKGLVTLFVKDDVVESLLVRVRGDGLTTSASNWLWFDTKEPYVKATDPKPSSYARLTNIQNIQVTFSRLIDPATVIPANFSVLKYDKDGNSTVEALTLITNLGGRGVLIHLASVNQTNDILTRYFVSITTDVRSFGTGLRLSANPNDALLYGAPFTNSLFSAIDRKVGALVDMNLPGTTVPSDMKLLIAAGELPVSAYISISQPDESVAIVREADERVRQNQYLQTIPDLFGAPLIKEIKGFGTDGAVLQDLNGVTLVLSYNESGGNVTGSEGSVSEDELNIFWLNEATGRWEYVGKPEIDKANNTVSIKIYKYGKYALMGDSTSKSFQESLIVYPNPFDPTKQLMNVRFYVEKRAYVSAEIFTLTGEKVRPLAARKYLNGGQVYENEVVWDGKNGRGMVVVNGVYIVKTKIEYVDGSGSKEKLFKVAVRK